MSDRPVPQVTCHDCLVVQPAVFTEPTVDGGFLQECVNCMVTIHHEGNPAPNGEGE